jgi:hypothetical protein
MPSSHHGHLRHLGLLSILSYWMDDMPSGHFSHLVYLGTIGNLDTLDPIPLATTLTDSYHGAFITEMDPDDPGPLEGYFVDNSLDPLSTATPLLPHYTS